MDIASKVGAMAILMMLPAQGWLLWSGTHNTLPSYPWPAVIGLTSIVLTVTTCTFVAKGMFANALTSATVNAIPHVSASGVRIEKIYFSSVDYLNGVVSLPWHAKYLGILPSGFPRMRGTFGISLPTVYFAIGSLVITPEQMTVAAAMVGDNVGNFCTDDARAFSFSFTPGQILSAQRFDIRKTANWLIPLPFFRIQTTVAGAEDFLVCTGALDFWNISQETSDLWAALGTFLSKRTPISEGHKAAIATIGSFPE